MTGREPPTSDVNLGAAATYHERAEYPLPRGVAVCDIRELVTSPHPNEEPGVAVVVDTASTSEDDVHTTTFRKDGVEISLAEYHLNRHYADFEVSERVVTIAWDSLLDGLAPKWRDHLNDPDAMMAYFDRLRSDWDVPVAAHDRTYSYPESRLIQLANIPDRVAPDV